MADLPASTEPRKRLHGGLRALAAAAALAACGWIMQANDAAFLAPAATAPELLPTAPWLLWLRNVLPLALLLLFLLGLTARLMLAALLTLGITALLYWANALKLEQLGTPVMPADFSLLVNLGKRGSALLLHYLPRDRLAIALTLAAVAALVMTARRERPLRVLRGWRRLALGGSACLLCLSLYRGGSPWHHWYAASDDFAIWIPTQHAEQQGLLAHLLLYRWATAAPAAAPDRAAATALLAQYRPQLQPDPPSAATSQPDIIIVQSESLFDPTRLRGLEHADLLPQLHRLAATAQHGELWPPTFGGGTIRTEFEVLTGIAMRYFPQVQYPYFGLTATREQSIARILRRQGYRTVAVHPHDRSFWNRAAALTNLGFDEFDAEEEFGDAPREGWYISDEALVDHVLKRLQQADTPVLILAISMENHGPYTEFPNVDSRRRDAQPVPPGLDAEAAAMLRGYLYHADNADRALGRLAAALRQRQRRSLLLFYGDHLPALPQVYAQLGFVDGRGADQQPVPWLLLDSADPRAHAPVATAAFYLPALLLDTAGLQVDAYFSLLEAVRGDDHVQAGWVPPASDALGAIMQLRQRREFTAFAREQLASARADSIAP